MNFPTPCYVLEEIKLLQNLRLLNSVHEKSRVEILLALKAFSSHTFFPIIKRYLNGASASSLNEARLIYEEMNYKAHVYAPAYIPKEFKALNQYTSHLIFNSLQQYHLYKDQVLEGISCGIRVNPNYSEIEVPLYDPCDRYSRLGVTHGMLADGLPEGIEGLHFHALCENNSYTLEKVLEALEMQFGKFLKEVKWLNMGGGHLITDKEYEVDHLVALLNAFQKKYNNLKLYIEPGSAVVWETGFLATTVLDIIKKEDVLIVILDTSFTCHMPDCLEMPYQPRVRGTSMEGTFKYILGGVSCLAGDQVGIYHFNEPLNVGDQVIFEDMMHYTMVKTTTFNGVNLPSFGMIKMDGSFETIDTFGFEAYKNRF